MTAIEFTLQAKQSLAVSWAKEIAFSQTSEQYITGSALRGAVAAAWLVDHDGVSSDFAEIFEGQVCFEPVMPDRWHLVPLSVCRCKYRPEDGCDEWFADATQLMRDDGSMPPVSCGVCDGSVEYSKGELAGPYESTDDGADITDLRVERVRTAVDPVTGSSRERALFSQQALAPSLTFHGRISHLDALSDSVREGFVAWFAAGRALRLGRGKSVMGKANVLAATSTVETHRNVASGRHVLRCLSPVIILDDFGRATTDIRCELRRHGLARAQVVREWSRPALIGGWHAVSGLPKPSDFALVAGTTWVIDVADNERAAWDKVVLDGLGYRRREGFGVVAVDPLPWEPPLKVAQSASTAVPIESVKAPLDKLILAMKDERELRAIPAEGVTQIRELLRALDRADAKEAVADVRARPFWAKRSTRVIEVRDELVTQVMGKDRSDAGRKQRARKALHLLEEHLLDGGKERSE